MTTTATHQATARRALPHAPGLVYFWFLNDRCEPQHIDRMIRAFADAGVAGVCLHPRPGLLLPYGGTDWFDFIQQTAERCIEAGLTVWLYDEDPYPSGACGGWVTALHPELKAHGIDRFTADGPDDDGLFAFPPGQLLWCGLVRESDGSTHDLTDRVGVVRRQWHVLDPWDSRNYYPNTPLYNCPRNLPYGQEFALRVPEDLDGHRLMAFVARPFGSGHDTPWDGLPDTLNPKATELFIQWTHERYAERLGQYFGKQIPAIFTDEPKPHAPQPWTPGMLEDFQARFGYDLRPRLWHLFADDHDDAQAALTRIHYRDWIGQRFEKAWLEPISEWCDAHKLQFVGHVSPEDDPAQQADTIGNLMPQFKYFAIPGIDLIIPAVGDHRHPLINVGILLGTSAAQQQNKPGVLSETLGASGHDMTVKQSGRVLRWQTMMGLTSVVVHGAFNSMEGYRYNEAPPDYGPLSERWDGMQAIEAELRELQPLVTDARQEAPVAVLWPIRSFHAEPYAGLTHDSPRRDAYLDLLRELLDRQVGVHVIDEATLTEAVIEDGELRIGRARYRHVLVGTCKALATATVETLKHAATQGVDVTLVDEAPTWQQGDEGLQPFVNPGWPLRQRTEAAQGLPRLIETEGDAMDVRCTAWEKQGRRTRLLLNLSDETRTLQVEGHAITLPPHVVHVWPDGESPRAVTPTTES
ncbi:MAG: hypothetical protein ACODAQ_05595 [Phycisphaeraceae bacterium]